MVGDGRDEIVFWQAGHINYIAPFPSRQKLACASARYVRVDVGRIDRVGHSDAVVVAKDVADVS